MKLIVKYYSLILSAILIVNTIVDYIDYKPLVDLLEKDNLPIEIEFYGWYLTFSFIIIALYEFVTNNKFFKLLARILLTLILLARLFSNIIPIEDFDAGVENTAAFSGMIAIILFFVLGLKKIYFKIFNHK